MGFEITSELENVYKGFLFEGIVACLWLVLLLIILNHYRKKKSKMTAILLASFTSYFLGLVFSWIAKLIQLSFGYNSIVLFPPETPNLWLIARITQYRISFTFIVIGTYFTNKFQGMVFDTETKQLRNKIILVLTIITILVSLILYFPSQEIFDLITFGLAFIVMLMCYIPFMIHAFKMGFKMEKAAKVYKTAFISLGIMCVCFLMILLGMLFDRAMIIFVEGCEGYTVFYYMGWISAIIGVFTTFMGYIRPTLVKPSPSEN
ncbi:hypothetical protein [Candidatus Lokiarchaeum ossiferum]|uniref:hypothetical protein n=1 Tax=Candidatus Lokiarchaeum ossiferum TaxID=2951803 RepID=UPI00352C4B9F